MLSQAHPCCLQITRAGRTEIGSMTPAIFGSQGKEDSVISLKMDTQPRPQSGTEGNSFYTQGRTESADTAPAISGCPRCGGLKIAA